MNTTQTTLLAALTLSLTLTLSAPITAQAEEKHHPAAAPGATASAPATATATAMTDGEVRKIDLDAGKLTLKHADIKSLDMPAMTMVFVVKDKALLDKLKTGDKIKFRAINDAGKFTVTEIQTSR